MICFHHLYSVVEVPATIIREMKEEKGIKIGEGEVKMSPFVGDTTGSIGNL